MRVLIALLLMCSVFAAAEDAHYIAVNAEGWVEVEPDMLTLDVGIRQVGKDVTALQGQVDQLTRQVVTAARELGVGEGDIDSARINIQPDYEWKANTRIYRGQSVQRTVSITLRDTSRYGELVAAVSRHDVESMGQPRLTHSNFEALRLEALDRALERGRVRAERIARGIGAKLGPVIRVEELDGARPVPVQRMAMMEQVGGASPEIDFGKQRIPASVSMRFAID